MAEYRLLATSQIKASLDKVYAAIHDGLANCAVNLYALAPLFPWFVGARGWTTLAARLVFGVSLTDVSLLCAPPHSRPTPERR